MKQYSSDPTRTFQEQMRFFLAGKQKGQAVQYRQVTITRERATQHGSSTSWTATCIRVDISTDTSSLNIEGIKNLEDANPQNFIFTMDTDVAAGTDTVTDGGQKWRVFSVSPIPMAGGYVEKIAFCLTE